MGASVLFSWIHLSDIHVGHGEATHIEDQRLVLSTLRNDVAQMLNDGVPHPDAIFVTGDIAFSGACRSSDEYDSVAQWLNAIASAAGLGANHVFVVPGNHDVQRPADKPLAGAALLRELRSGATSIDAALATPDTTKHLATRQANYLSFASSFAPACRADAEAKGAQLFWRHTLPARDGLRVRVVGLNTALLAADENAFGSDQGRLWLGTKQLAATLIDPDVTSNEVVIVLSHHPLQDRWLGDQDEAAGWIRSKAHVHLAGHVHEAASIRQRGGGGVDIVSVVAGAVHGEKTPHGCPARHGYSFGAIVTVGGVLKVRIWPQLWSKGNNDFRRDNDHVPRNQAFAEHEISRVRFVAP